MAQEQHAMESCCFSRVRVCVAEGMGERASRARRPPARVLLRRRRGVERCVVAARLSRREQRVASSCSAGQALWCAAKCVVGVRVSSSDRGEAAAKTRLRPHQDSERMVVFSFFSSRGAVYSVFGEDGTELALIPFPPVSPPPWRLSPQAKWSRLGVNPAF